VRIFPVGRLDMNTEGLLILTNDGRLAICSPIRVRDPKEYLARVEGDPRRGDSAPADGVELEDGVTSPAKSVGSVKTLAYCHPRGPQSSGPSDVRRGRSRRDPLVRTRIGPIQDATLSPGSSRQLSLAEVRRLMEAVGMSDAIASTMPT